MRSYAAIGLHSGNVLTILDENDHVVFERRLPNECQHPELAEALNAAPGNT